jgi:hypothetical protein
MRPESIVNAALRAATDFSLTTRMAAAPWRGIVDAPVGTGGVARRRRTGHPASGHSPPIDRPRVESGMPRAVAVHIDGHCESLDAELVMEIRPIDPLKTARHGTVVTLRDGTEMQVDEAVVVMALLLEPFA